MRTSDPDETIVRRAFALGARDYLLKPFYSDRLDTAVTRLLPPHPTADPSGGAS